MILVSHKCNKANHIRHRSPLHLLSVTNHWRLPGYPRSASSIDLIPWLQCGTPGCTNYYASFLTYRLAISGNLMLFLDDQLIRSNYSTTSTPSSLQTSSFDPSFRSTSKYAFSLNFLRQFCDLQLKRNEFSSMSRTHAHICNHNPPSSTSSRSCKIAFQLFASFHNSLLLFHHYTHCSIFTSFPIPSYHHNYKRSSLPALIILMCVIASFEMRLES